MRRAIFFVLFVAAIMFGVLLPGLVPESFQDAGIELPMLHISQASVSRETLLLTFRVIGVGFALAGGFLLLRSSFRSRPKAR